MANRLVVYHANCTDGFTAAWVAWRLYGDEADYLAAQYGDPVPDVTGRNVLIVDFSYPRAELERMHSVAASLRVIDHHKTAKADLDGLPFCTFDMARSGAGLAWDLLHAAPRLKLIDYVEDRDLWTWKLPDSREVSAYIATVPREFAHWDTLVEKLETAMDRVAEAGRLILGVTESYVESLAKKPGQAIIGGHTVPCINTTFATSELVGKLAESAPFAVGWFERDDGMVVYSLRSRGVDGLDVSEIAKSYGGGGHRNAAGFTVGEPIHRVSPC